MPVQTLSGAVRTTLFLNQNICCGTQKDRPNERVLLSTQNICLD